AKMTAEFLNKLIEKSNPILSNHQINKKRKSEGKRIASHVWFWSGGKKPEVKSFKEKYNLTGSVISAVDLIFGIGIAGGLEPIHVEGATGLPDTNYEGKANAALKSLKTNDYVYVHVEATDEMGHAGDVDRKIKALQNFDGRIVKPFLDAEKDFNNELIIAVLPDHPTPCEIRTHSRDPVPFVIYNPSSSPPDGNRIRLYSEKEGAKGEFGLVENGEEFMKLLLL
ncbi:MAG: phosphoglycerate mutase, partial [archaeon]|nr:phosphoglycerate mutase [archaeon]